MKNSIDLASLPPEKDEHSVLMEKIRSLVKKNIKDPFIEKLLDTQMVSNMVCRWNIKLDAKTDNNTKNSNCHQI